MALELAKNMAIDSCTGFLLERPRMVRNLSQLLTLTLSALWHSTFIPHMTKLFEQQENRKKGGENFHR